MEPSKQSEEILNLGRKLAEQLGPEHSHDVLGHWLSYYLAELMTTAKSAEGERKKALEDECVAIILKIWENRAYAPRGARPLENLEPAIRLLDEIANAGDHSWSAFLFRGKNPWHKAGATVHEASELMKGLLLYSQTSQVNWHELSKWRETLPTLMKEQERALIEGIQAMTARVGYYYGLDKEEQVADHIDKLVVEKLRGEVKRQSDAIDELEKALRNKKI